MAEKHQDDHELREAAPTEHAPDGKYVYAIIECNQPRSFKCMGIGGRGDSVYTINHNGLAAVVSDTPVVVYDPTRENAMTHEAVNEAAMEEFTVIPMSFGTVFRTTDDVVEFLKHTSEGTSPSSSLIAWQSCSRALHP